MNLTPPPQLLHDHVVICNCNEKIGKIVEELRSKQNNYIDVVLLIQDLELWKNNPSWHPENNEKFYTVVGLPTQRDVLNQAQIHRAHAAIILADPAHGKLADARSTLVAMAIEEQNPRVHTVMELIASINRPHLKAGQVDEVICLGQISEKIIAQSCFNPGVKNIFLSLLTTQKGTNQIFVSDIPIEFNGLTYREVAKRSIINNSPFVICGFIQWAALGPKFILNPLSEENPGKDTELKTNDKLLILAYTPPTMETILGI